MMAHPKISVLAITGGPGIVAMGMKSGKKVIGAGAGNPPCIVDETADIVKAAEDIINGASFDHSPVGVAMVKVVKPSPPTPIPAQEGPFLTKIEVCITRAARLSRETFCECIIAVWCKPSSTFSARVRALSKSLTFTSI